MFAYNRSDWTYGWMAAFDGFTVFYSEVNLVVPRVQPKITDDSAARRNCGSIILDFT